LLQQRCAPGTSCQEGAHGAGRLGRASAFHAGCEGPANCRYRFLRLTLCQRTLQVQNPPPDPLPTHAAASARAHLFKRQPVCHGHHSLCILLFQPVLGSQLRTNAAARYPRCEAVQALERSCSAQPRTRGQGPARCGTMQCNALLGLESACYRNQGACHHQLQVGGIHSRLCRSLQARALEGTHAPVGWKGTPCGRHRTPDQHGTAPFQSSAFATCPLRLPSPESFEFSSPCSRARSNILLMAGWG
jgi:hypothetical protein